MSGDTGVEGIDKYEDSSRNIIIRGYGQYHNEIVVAINLTPSDAGIILWENYPKPLVDLSKTREKALTTYKLIR